MNLSNILILSPVNIKSFAHSDVMMYKLLCRYGLPFVSPHNMLVSTINGAGAVIETVYVLTFIAFAPRKEKLKILGLFAAVVAVFSAVAMVSLFALHGKPRMLFCGFAATVFSIIMYGSPLSIMVTILISSSSCFF